MAEFLFDRQRLIFLVQHNTIASRRWLLLPFLQEEYANKTKNKLSPSAFNAITMEIIDFGLVLLDLNVGLLTQNFVVLPQYKFKMSKWSLKKRKNIIHFQRDAYKLLDDPWLRFSYACSNIFFFTFLLFLKHMLRNCSWRWGIKKQTLLKHAFCQMIH